MNARRIGHIRRAFVTCSKRWGRFIGVCDVDPDVDGGRIAGMRVTRARRLAFFIGVDAFVVLTSLALAIFLRFGDVPAESQITALPLVAALALASTLISMQLLGVYRAAWSFVGLRDVARIGVAVALATLVSGGLFQVGWGLDIVGTFPRSAILIHAPIAFCALAAFRLSRRAYLVMTHSRLATRGSPTLLVGAGQAGEQVLKSIQETGAPYDVRGFLDDDALAQGTVIHGVRVVGRVADLDRIVQEEGIETIIISVASATATFVQDVVRRSKAAKVPIVRIVPSLSELVDGNVSISTTREVKLEDLLGRDAVKINNEDVRELLSGRRVLVTGGAGTIGGELCRQVARFGPSRLVVLDLDETRLHDIGLDLRHAHPDLVVREALVDVRHAAAVRDIFAEERPEIVFHAAAYKHVPMMELYPVAALETNVLGTANVIDAAEGAGTQRLILISTDKAVEPSSLMGASKRLAELALFGRAHEPVRMVRSAVRFGNVIGSRGSLIPTFERQLAHGGPLTVTHPDMQRYFMMTSEAVSLVLQAATMGQGRDIFVLDMGKPVRILDVAREFVRLHGLEPERDMRIVFTGLRPGEKMFEILTYPDEHARPTHHSRLLRVSAGEAEPPAKLLDTVRGLVSDRNAHAARAYMRHLFPTIDEAAVTARSIATQTEAASVPTAPSRST